MSNIKTPISALVLDKETNSYQFDEKKLSSILTRPEIADLPIAIVSIAGDPGIGKSFLLNLFLRYLQRFDQENWLGDGDEPLQGFPWGQEASNRGTIGIVLWPEPLTITKKDGTKIAVLLMDTHGFFDTQVTHSDDLSNIFATLTVISSIQVFNQRHDLRKLDVTQLSKLIDYVKYIEDLSCYKAFQKIVLLARDRVPTIDFPSGSEGGQDFLKFIRSKYSPENNEAWETLYEFYSEIDCFLISKPDLAAYEYNFTGALSQLDSEFIVNILEFVPSLLSPENIVTKTWLGKEQKAHGILALFKTIVEKFKYSGYIEVQKLLRYSLEDKMITIARQTLERFRTIYSELNPHDDPKKVESSLLEARSRSKKIYSDETKNICEPSIVKEFGEIVDSSIDDYIADLMKGLKEKESNYSSWSNYDMSNWLSKILKWLLSGLTTSWFRDFDSRMESRLALRASDNRRSINTVTVSPKGYR